MQALSPRFAGGGERRIERAQAVPDDADARSIDVVAPLQHVDDSADRRAPFMRHRQMKRGLALAWPIERQGGDAAIDEAFGPGMELFLAGIEPGQDDRDRRPPAAARFAQPPRHRHTLVGKLDAFDRRIEMRRGRGIAAQHGIVRAAKFLRPVGEQVLAVMVADRRANE